MNLKEILRQHTVWLCDNESGRRADLWNTNLWNADLRNANLGSVNLGNADLRTADLRNADLRNANLVNANLWNANLRNANLRNADLRNANLWNANLWNANLRNANLRNANLVNADLRGTSLSILQINQYTAYIHAFTSTITIGCQEKTFEEWSSISADDLLELDSQGPELRERWLPIIKAILEDQKLQETSND